MANYGNWQFEIYFNGLSGERPDLPMTYEELERRAEAVMSTEMWSYVSGGAGNERTQRANVAAFDRWGFMPRILAGATTRDLSIDLFGTLLPTPLLFAPVGVIGICDPDGHGDVLTARAAAASGVPMIASTLTQDPMEVVAKELGETPGWFQLYPPHDDELTESFVRRAEASGFSAIVVTLDTLTLGWRTARPVDRELSPTDGTLPRQLPVRSSLSREARHASRRGPAGGGGGMVIALR